MVGDEGVEGLSKKEKGLMDMDNSVVIAGGGDRRGLNSNGKNTIKILKRKQNRLKGHIFTFLMPGVPKYQLHCCLESLK